jgi:hypothetical protein
VRFAWLASATTIIVVAACSGGKGTNLSLPPLRIQGALRATGGYCDVFARRTKATFEPSGRTSSATVYAVDSVAVDRERASEIARRFGLTVSPQWVPDYRVLRLSMTEESGAIMEVPAFVAEDSNVSLAVEERTGIIHYRLKSSSFGTSTDIATAEQRKDAATRFLRSTGLLPIENVETRVEGSLVRWELPEARVVENFTPLGIYVNVDDDGTVNYITYAWQNLHSLGEYPLASESEALQRLSACEAYIWSAARGEPTVSEARLEYLALPVDGPYRYIVPVYHFGNELALEGTPRPNDLKDSELITDAWVIAIADEYVEPPALDIPTESP